MRYVLEKQLVLKKEYFKAECNRLAFSEHPFAIYIYKN